MRRQLLSVLFVALIAAPLSGARAEVFSYTDAQGNLHFVDSEAKIPPEYRTEKKTIELPAHAAPAGDIPEPEPEAGADESSGPAAGDAARAAPLGRDRDGHDEQWWQRRKEKLEAKKRRIEAELAKLDDAAPINVQGFYTRKALYERGQKKERLEKELAEVEAQIAGLREEARRAGAPPGWLR